MPSGAQADLDEQFAIALLLNGGVPQVGWQREEALSDGSIPVRLGPVAMNTKITENIIEIDGSQ